MADKRAPSAANAELASCCPNGATPLLHGKFEPCGSTNGWLGPRSILRATPGQQKRPIRLSPSIRRWPWPRSEGVSEPSLDAILLGLFARGHVVPIEQLRSAFRHQLFDGIRKLRQRLAAESQSPDDVADTIAIGMATQAKRTKTGRFMLRNAKGQDDSAVSILTSAQTLLATVMLGGDLEPFHAGGDDALDDLIDLTGMHGLAQDQVVGGGSIVSGGREELRSDLIQTFASGSIDDLDDLLESASFDELAASRQA